MKKIYLLLLTFSFSIISFGQSPIVVVDRANIIGPTDTGNSPLISSMGLTRGSGISLRNGANKFNSKSWDASSLSGAITNEEYVEWSVISNENYDVEITELDIRLRGSDNGPDFWQIQYSTDGFASVGTSIGVSQAVPLTNTDYNFNGLTINSDASGVITFRMFAWGPSTGSGWFRIETNTAWAGFGINFPGLRLLGNITSSSVNNTESNIVRSIIFDEPDNIVYTDYSATSGLTTTNSIKIGEFIIQDGGDDLSDTDSVGTILTDIEFDVINANSVEALGIFDGTTNISEGIKVESTFSFSAINSGSGITAPDNGIKSFDIYATFTNTVTDNEQILLAISSASADGASGSTFFSLNAGGAVTSTDGDNNKIEVIASGLLFGQQPMDTNQFETMTPFPTLLAIDDNSNNDLDAIGTVSVLSAGSLSGAPIDYSILGGVAVLNTLSFTEKETNITLFAFGSDDLGFTVSNSFDVNGPLISIAVQDFDNSSPNWGYTNDVPFFDNGWGSDGFYGIIDASSASPIDYPSFKNNILGENDLDDGGVNGTDGYANINFDIIDISSFENVKLSFDWQVIGYNAGNEDAQYELFYNGASQGIVLLFDGFGGTNPDASGTVNINVPSDIDTIGLILSIRNNGLTGFSGFDNFKLTSVFDGLLYTDNGWSPNAPSSTTGSDNAYVLDGTYSIGTNIQVNNLYVAEAATTIVSFGQSIKTNTGLVNFGVIELNSASTSYSSLISNNVRGEVIYNRHVNQLADTGSSTGKNDLIAAPVTNTNQTFLEFRTANPDVPSGTIDGVPSFLFGPFDKDTNDYINYTTADDGSLIEAGVGYRTASTAATGSAFRFVGNVETTTKLVPISIGTATDFNLIGNPYPSYIKLSDFLSDNNSEFSAANSGVYGYDGSATDGFTIWNQAYSDDNPSAVIAPGQGFLVTSKVGGGTIIFDAASRSIGTTDDFVVGRVSEVDLAHVKLEMTSDTHAFRTDIYFNNNATLGMDAGYDSGMFQGQAPEFAIFSHLVADNSGLDLAVQSVNYNALNTVVIPLGVNANQGEQLTIGILEMDIPEGIEVYLEDTLTNTFTLLNTSEYVLTPSTNLSGTGRFFLRFTADALSTSENNFETIQIYTTKTPKTLFIKGALENNTTVEIYDIQGRMILSSKLDTSRNSNQIDISGFTSGIYVVKLNNELQQKSKKVIIK